MPEELGRCFGETSHMNVSFISDKIPQIGEYVYLKYNDQVILGMIESLFRGNKTLSDDLLKPEVIDRILSIEGEIDHYIRGNIKILGDKDKLRIPRTPAPPGTVIYKADKQLLKEVFESGDGINIGTILTDPDVCVKLDVNKMVSRHLAILAMTGAGKSNATSVIIDELLSIGGTMIVFDMHSEYYKSEYSNGKTKRIIPKLNPQFLSIAEYKQLLNIGENASIQESYLREAYKYVKNNSQQGGVDNFIYEMIQRVNTKRLELENEERKRNNHIEATSQVIFKLEDMQDKYKSLLDSTDVGDIVNQIAMGRLNILDLGSLDEKATDIIVKHTLTNILYRRKNFVKDEGKKTLDFPIFCIIEEAHNIASNDRNTKSRHIIGKIAREGRKFGVGLCLVSQSPKSLDKAALSQMNNMIILRLIEPEDQKHIQKSSESLSDDLLEQLPSLNIGEAIVIGQMTRLPTLVKVNEFKGKTVGNDLDIAGIWRDSKRKHEEKIEQQKKEISLGI
ncbi:MAG: ATPase [Methanosphaera sp. rholeuAM74]|nr:MAG: ATPase [Methanosphaera sp. rholeuAM74]